MSAPAAIQVAARLGFSLQSVPDADEAQLACNEAREQVQQRGARNLILALTNLLSALIFDVFVKKCCRRVPYVDHDSLWYLARVVPL